MNGYRSAFLGSVACAMLLATAARGQTQTDMAAMAHHAAGNELGVLEYCKSRGDVGQDPIDAQKTVIAHLPASGTSTEADEVTGRQGTLASPNGQTMSLSEVAARQGTTVPALCRTLGDGVIQSARAGAGGMTMPAMPSMSNMPSMPGMPSMPSMPSMSH